MPPYDNKEYRYRDDDTSSHRGRERVAALLGVPLPRAARVRFDLSFFSGGIGVLDSHAISMDADDALWGSIIKHIKAKPPNELADDEVWGEDFKWLLAGDESFLTIEDAATAFINSEKNDFQSRCEEGMRIYFSKYSNVNDWAALWGTSEQLNFLAYSQG